MTQRRTDAGGNGEHAGDAWYDREVDSTPVNGPSFQRLANRGGHRKNAGIAADRLGQAVYVERGTTEHEKLMPMMEKQDDSAPYFAIVLVAGRWWTP